MDRVIKLLREQIILCSRLSNLFEELSNALKQTRSALNIETSVKNVQSLMKDLSDNDNHIQEFLKSENVENLKIYIENQPESIERNVAVKILEQTNNLQKKIRHQITTVAKLMMNSQSFINFNLNVMAQTVADTTYGPSSNVGQYQRRHVFNANV